MREHPEIRKFPALPCTNAMAALVLGAFMTACVSTPQTAPESLPSGAWAGDPTHTSVVFRIDHGNGLSRYTARFDRTEASLDFDPEAPQAARLTAQIEAASISTGLPDFDTKLAGSVFQAGQHPYITFRSVSITALGEQSGTVTGELTMAGVTRPATLDVVFNGGAFDPLRQSEVIGFSATTTIDRTEWGLDNWVRFGVGREVEIAIEIEFEKVAR